MYKDKNTRLTYACTGMAPWEYKQSKGKTSGSARDLFDVKLKTLALIGDALIEENMKGVKTLEGFSEGLQDACSRVALMRKAMNRE